MYRSTLFRIIVAAFVQPKSMPPENHIINDIPGPLIDENINRTQLERSISRADEIATGVIDRSAYVKRRKLTGDINQV